MTESMTTEGADTQPKHKRRHNNCNRLDVHPDNYEQEALPGNLIHRRSKSRQKESRRNAGCFYGPLAYHPSPISFTELLRKTHTFVGFPVKDTV